MMEQTFTELLKDLDLTERYWPETLGRITKTKEFDSPYFVYIIEDVHFGLDVQRAVMEILRYLHQHHQLRHIYLEGSQGEFIDLSRVGPTLTPKEIRELNILLKDKTITAPEYLAMTGELPIILYGVEDRAQYIQNVEAQSQAHTVYKVFGNIFERLEAYVTDLKTNTYSQELLNFDQALREHEIGKLRLSDIFNKWLRKYDKQGKIRLNRYPNLEVAMKAIEMEDAVAQAKVNPERNRLVADIIAILGKECVPHELFDRVVQAKYKLERRDTEEIKKHARSALVAEYKHLVNGILKRLAQIALQVRLDRLPTKEMYGLLIDLSSLCGIDIRQYPNLLMYTHLLHQYHALQTKELLEHFRLITEEAQEALFSNATEREVARVWRAVSGLHKICRLESSPDSYDRFISDFGQLSLGELMKKIIIKESMSSDEYEQWCKDMLIDSAEGNYSRKLDEIVMNLVKAIGVDATAIDALLAEGGFGSELEPVTALFEASGVDIPSLADQIVEAVDVALAGAYKFYQLAPARGRSLAENTLRYMKANGVKVAALVSGGFLTSYIMPVLERESVSYKVITPKTRFSDITIDRYVNQFERDKTTIPIIQQIRNRAALLNSTEAGEAF